MTSLCEVSRKPWRADDFPTSLPRTLLNLTSSPKENTRIAININFIKHSSVSLLSSLNGTHHQLYEVERLTIPMAEMRSPERSRHFPEVTQEGKGKIGSPTYVTNGLPVCVCICMCRCVCTCLYRGQRTTLGILPEALLHHFVLLFGLSATEWTRLLAGEVHKAACLHFPSTGTRSMSYHTELTWVLGIELTALCLLARQALLNAPH